MIHKSSIAAARAAAAMLSGCASSTVTREQIALASGECAAFGFQPGSAQMPVCTMQRVQDHEKQDTQLLNSAATGGIGAVGAAVLTVLVAPHL
jgi:hypothetical protein